MKPNARKNRKLIKQYPFVFDILATRMEPFDGSGGVEVDDLTIKVEVADEDLMFRRADNKGLDEYSYYTSGKGSRKGRVMRRGEYAFAVNEEDEIINTLIFPRNRNEHISTLKEAYAWWVLWSSKTVNASGTGYLHNGNLCRETAYIVWVTVDAWYVDTKSDDYYDPGSRFGEFCDRSIHITVYGEPEEGFSELSHRANIFENLRLDPYVMMRGTNREDQEIAMISGMLYELCIFFRDEVYFNGMKQVLDEELVGRASGQFGSIEVICAEWSGDHQIMLSDANSFVTFQSRARSQHMSVTQQEGTLPQIRNLVRTVARLWNQESELREAFKPDENVSAM